jgi:hypothetical protein
MCLDRGNQRSILSIASNEIVIAWSCTNSRVPCLYCLGWVDVIGNAKDIGVIIVPCPRNPRRDNSLMDRTLDMLQVLSGP